MKRHLIIGFIVLSIMNVNLFALGNFVQQQKSHHHEFCSLLAHDHHHSHHNTLHSHGHSHKINLVDFFSVETAGMTRLSYERQENYMLRQWSPELISIGLFRPPIA